MENAGFKEFKTNKVTMQSAPCPEGIRLSIQGSIEVMNSQDDIPEYFNDFHDTIISSDIRLLELDITGVSFINSSGIGALVRWFMKVPLLPEEKRYKIIVLFSSKVHWQKNGLQVLKQISGGMLTLKEV